jgi:hypothetical protein
VLHQKSTISAMATKKPAQAKPNKKHVIYATVPQALREALEAYIDKTRPHPDKSAVVEAAIEDFLRSQGFWPPQNHAAS